jgi:hypothetical protein
VGRDGPQQIDGDARGLKAGIIDDALDTSSQQPTYVVTRK